MADKIIRLAAATYDVYDVAGDSTSTVTVPTLTAGSIAEATPEIGDTLTITGSNASNTATFQWQQSADGSTGWANISGATAATLDTSSGVTTDYYVRRGVADGEQSMVYTAAEQVSAAATGPTFVGFASQVLSAGGGATTVSFPTGTTTGDAVFYVVGADGDAITVSTSDTSYDSDSGGSPSRQIGVRVVQGGDTGISVTPAATKDTVVGLYAFRGQHADVVRATPTLMSGSGSVDPPSLTPGAAGDIYIAFQVIDDVDISGTNPPAGFTDAGHATAGASFGASASVAGIYLVAPDTSAIDPAAWNVTDSGSEPVDGVAFILKRA